ncbi:MAG TPA: diacylglycerol kinase family protein [Bryobacteraceae bacterium]|nr:diacylglycerol kinase family protein [Bryobacteraceae bacterium]
MIYNPAAGRLRGAGHQRLERAVKALRDAGYTLSMAPTTGPGTAGDIACQAIREGSEMIFAAGGDGTLNEVIQGMAHSTVPLGILPAGTANVLATEIGLGNDLGRAVKIIPKCVTRRIALGCLDCGEGQRYFLSMAGAGFDAQIVHDLASGLKERLGKAAYWVAGFAHALKRFPEFAIEIDGTARATGSFALASRVRNYGGDFEIARHARLAGDCFEVVLFRGRNALPYFKYLCGMIAGRLEGMGGVSFQAGQEVRVFDPAGRCIHIQVDGEYAGRLPASIVIVPNALTLLVPPEYASAE